MTLRNVPWATSGGVDGQGGAHNSVELARVGMYAGTQGATGIIEPTDLKVIALPVPGGAVRVLKGTGVIKSTYPNTFGQSYAVQEDGYTDVPVSATGSGDTVTKYVYIRIDDSQYYGQAPADVENGPYNSYQVSTSLPTIQPYLLLAKINQPASRSDIQPDMIEDMREVAVPRKDFGSFARPRIGSDSGIQMALHARYVKNSETEYGELFPGGDGIVNWGVIHLPEWATHSIISAKWMGIVGTSGQNCWGRYWVEYGDEYRAHGWPNGKQYEFATQQFGFNTTGTSGNYRESWLLDDAKPIPKKLRGKDVTFAFKAGYDPSSDNSGVYMDSLGGVSVRVDYVQQREDPHTI